MFESLEIRVLLSATFDSTTGLLKVTGTPLADSIRLTQSGLVLTLLDNGASSTFDATKVKQISVYGLGGNDMIALRGPGGGDVSIRSLLDGGATSSVGARATICWMETGARMESKAGPGSIRLRMRRESKTFASPSTEREMTARSARGTTSEPTSKTFWEAVAGISSWAPATTTCSMAAQATIR